MRRNFGLMGKVGLCVLLLTFVILPISPSVSLAAGNAVAGDAAAGGAAGAGGLSGLSTLSIVGITALAVVLGAVIISSIDDDDDVVHH